METNSHIAPSTEPVATPVETPSRRTLVWKRTKKVLKCLLKLLGKLLLAGALFGAGWLACMVWGPMPEEIDPEKIRQEVLDEVRQANSARDAAAQGDAKGLYDMAMLTLGGTDNEVVAADAEQAMQFLQQSAELGYAEAQYCLYGFLHTGTTFAAQDEERAVAYLQQAVAQSHPAALCKMGRILLGLDDTASNAITPNGAQGIELLTAAAEQGHADAMLQLSDCYAKGIGVERNQSLSDQWAQRYDEAEWQQDDMSF